jgi:hypothetical protein
MSEHPDSQGAGGPMLTMEGISSGDPSQLMMMAAMAIGQSRDKQAKEFQSMVRAIFFLDRLYITRENTNHSICFCSHDFIFIKLKIMVIL